MATAPFLGEIRSFSFNFVPRGWAQCNGQLLGLRQNTALFAVLGTAYGGDGQTTFGLPNLQGRVPVGIATSSSDYYQGAAGGAAFVSLTTAQTPLHSHAASGTTAANSSGVPSGLLPGVFPSLPGYTTDDSQLTPLRAGAVSSVGSSQPHENRQPFLTLNMCIALTGIFPQRP